IFGPAGTSALAPDRLASSATSVIETVPEPETLDVDAPAAPAMPVGPAVPVAGPPALTGALRELAGQAQQHLEAAEAAQRAGDWATYGEELQKLEDVILRMQDVEP